jgi:hypothetical protein
MHSRSGTELMTRSSVFWRELAMVGMSSLARWKTHPRQSSGRYRSAASRVIIPIIAP